MDKSPGKGAVKPMDGRFSSERFVAINNLVYIHFDDKYMRNILFHLRSNAVNLE